MSNMLPLSARVRVASALVDGCSIRATERITGITKKTIMAFGLRLGEGCAALHDRLVRGVDATDVQLDELWTFVQKKQARVDPEKDPEEYGDAYTWVALERNQKLVIAYLVGKRDEEHASVFVKDLRQRMLCRTIPQLTSDGLAAYIAPIEKAFGRNGVDYAQVVKEYSGGDSREDRHFEPGRKKVFLTKTRIFGEPDERRMSTSHVERQNLTVRMSQRRWTRLTNGFSKKRRNLAAAAALHFAWYNFCRVHESIRVTPAMQAGLSDHVWDVEELVTTALAEPVQGASPPPAGDVAPEQLDLFADAKALPVRPKLRLLKGGKAAAAPDVDDDGPPTERGTAWGFERTQAVAG